MLCHESRQEVATVEDFDVQVDGYHETHTFGWDQPNKSIVVNHHEETPEPKPMQKTFGNLQTDSATISTN